MASLIVLQKLTKHLRCSISIQRSWRRGAEGDGAHFRRGFVIEDLVGLLCDEDVTFLSDMPIHVDAEISFPAKTARKKLTQSIPASCLRIIACSRCLTPPSSVIYLLGAFDMTITRIYREGKIPLGPWKSESPFMAMRRGTLTSGSRVWEAERGRRIRE